MKCVKFTSENIARCGEGNIFFCHFCPQNLQIISAKPSFHTATGEKVILTTLPQLQSAIFETTTATVEHENKTLTQHEFLQNCAIVIITLCLLIILIIYFAKLKKKGKKQLFSSIKYNQIYKNLLDYSPDGL